MSIFDEDRPSQEVSASYGGLMKSVREPNLKERLQLEVERAEAKLADAKRAREILNANPELEELINILSRSRF